MTILHLPYLPFNFDGLALRWIILVKKGQDSIIPHEQVHIEQQKRIGIVKYMFKYLIFPDFRYWAEYEAYRKGSGLSVEKAEMMAEKYRNTATPFNRI